MISKQDKKVLIAYEVINKLIRQAKKEIRNERIQELIRDKSFLERFKLLIK